MKDFSPKTRTAAALAALALNLFVGGVGLFFAVSLARLAVVKTWIGMELVAACFGLGAILLLCEAADVLLKSRTGPMPIAMSSKRPFTWAAIAAIAIAMIMFAAASAGNPR